MHAIIADKHRHPTIQEGEALNTGKKLSQDSSDEIIKTEESKKAKSISDIAFASKFVGQMSRTRLSASDVRLSSDDDGTGDGAPK